MYTLKKSLGQHFLKDERVVARILEELSRHHFRQLLEVGPGGGALTHHLLSIPDIEFRAVELDQEKVDFLLKKYPSIQGKLLHEDFLKLDPPFEGSFTVIGNFPYNISSQILFKILDWQLQVPVVIGMFQKEVAERAAATHGNKTYGVLSVLVQYYYQVEYCFSVSAGSFVPQPKVESAVIRLTRRDQREEVSSTRDFRVLVKAAFNQRRKTLRNATRGLFTPEVLSDPLFDRRAETLSVAEFAALTFKLR